MDIIRDNLEKARRDYEEDLKYQAIDNLKMADVGCSYGIDWVCGCGEPANNHYVEHEIEVYLCNNCATIFLGYEK